MTDTSLAFITPSGAPAWKRWLVYSPLARILIFAITYWLLTWVIGHFVHGVVLRGAAKTPWNDASGYLSIYVVPAFLVYLALVKWIERRRMIEFAPQDWPRAWVGVIAGVLLFTVTAGALWLFGSYHVTGTHPHVAWLLALLTLGIGPGLCEEIVFRGVLFRIVEEGLGTWGALLISAIFFGGAHMLNPDATVWTCTAITIEAGLLIGMLYHVTRSLWLCMGLHAAWNFTEGTVYGIPVSGIDTDGWLISHRTGPEWLSGGAFGAEASVVLVGICSICTLALIAVALRRGSIVAPSWRRKKPEAVSADYAVKATS
ncbi:CPBP family intramembrane glutamic endopeptidase [Dyella caseinilytica]|uniref:CPBP family intramembrane metalloprotease n=1 Tax=Dyella caseinilytica TaxID=1849581 RepID=A0ABX7GSU8_9GAMM|nr:type II CAAX endopeptidase family protein [Dyella caseinilytica]QRN53043.1 CPBP family intramembrane metalloprotease [Dyella caseinilytica]GGA10988.1 CAAX amino protease [Dyella caseinilytica]